MTDRLVMMIIGMIRNLNCGKLMIRNCFVSGVFVFALLFASCVREDFETVDRNASCPKAVFSTVAPEFVGEAGTKTHLEGNSVKWDIGDEFLVIGSDQTRYIAKNTQEGYSAVFISDLTFDEYGGLNRKGKINELTDTRHVIVYPASVATGMSKYSSDGTLMTNMQIGNMQPLVPDSFGKGYNVAFALLSTGNGTGGDWEYNGDRLKFYNACGLLRLRLRSDTGAKIKSVKIIAPEGSALTGTGTVSCSLGGFINTSSNVFKGRRDVTLKAQDGAFELGTEVTDFYACVMPATTNRYSDDASFTKGEVISTGTGASAGEYTIIFTDADNYTLTTTVTLEKAVHSGTISTLGQFNIKADGDNWTSTNPYVADGLSYVFDKTALPEVHIDVTLEQWNKFLTNYDENPSNNEYVECDFTFIKNGCTHYIERAGLRMRGSTSRKRPEGETGQLHTVGNTTWKKCHFMFNLRKFVKDDDHEIGGVRKIYMKTFDNSSDPTYVKEIYAYDVFQKFGIWTGLEVSYCRLFLHVEGDPGEVNYGVYRMMECVDDGYVSSRWKEFGHAARKDEFNLWKCGTHGYATADLYDTQSSLFQHDDLAGYSDYPYILKTNLTLSDGSMNFDIPKAQIINFINNYKTLQGEEFRTWVESVLDVKQLLRTYAVVVMLSSTDDYWFGGKNYYVYFNSNDPENYNFFFIPYDFDKILGSKLTSVDPIKHNPFEWGHPNDTAHNHHLVWKLLTFPDYRQIYTDALNELCNNDEFFGDVGSVARITQWQAMVAPYVADDIDPNRTVKTSSGSYDLVKTGDKNYFTAKIKAVKEAIAADQAGQ